MPTGSWQARLAQGTTPAERVEAELRYAFAAPLVRAAALWVDLGCGDGVAAAAALGGEPAARAVLVDADADALASARRELGGEALIADLATSEGTAAVRAAVAEEPCVVTCFDVLHQLGDITALMELLVELGGRGTVVVGVASAGVAEELRRLLPDDARSFCLMPIRAAAIVGEGDAEAPGLGAVAIADDAAPAGHLLAFGTDAARLAPTARAAAADLTAERAEARRRESDLAYLEARVAAAEAS